MAIGPFRRSLRAMNKNTKTLSLLLVAVAFWALLNAGCNTIQGAGKDIERGGEKIQDAAVKNK